MNTVTISCTCPICGSESVINLDTTGYINYFYGMHVQDAFPNMSVIDREKLITGMCDKCQKLIFGNAA